MAKGDYLGEFEQLVVLSLLRLDNEGYGMLVRRELEQTTGREVTIGAVYGTLDRLEEKGLVSSWRSEPDPVRGGRSRRYFRVEPEGEAALARAREMFRKMWDGVELATQPESSGGT
jgi:DNA-binding PadR family transcriptional regulator